MLPGYLKKRKSAQGQPIQHIKEICQLLISFSSQLQSLIPCFFPGKIVVILALVRPLDDCKPVVIFMNAMLMNEYHADVDVDGGDDEIIREEPVRFRIRLRLSSLSSVEAYQGSPQSLKFWP